MSKIKGIQFVIKYREMAKEFEAGKIKAYEKELGNVPYIESLLYLWLFNNFSTCAKEVTEDCGRPMYRKLAKTLTRIIKEEAVNSKEFKNE